MSSAEIFTQHAKCQTEQSAEKIESSAAAQLAWLQSPVTKHFFL